MRDRGLVIRALTAVLSDRKMLDDALPSSLGGEDRAWVLDMTSGTLRWKGRLDLAIDSVALKKKPSGWLRKVLLMGAYQLVAQERVHAGLVVSESVDEIKRREGEAPAKFANALLRKVAEHAPAWRSLERPENPRAPEAAAGASLPEWFWHRLVRDHGAEWAWSFAQACLGRPELWVRARSDSWKPAAGEPGPVERSWRLPGGDPTVLPGFSAGEFIVQDISNQVLVSGIVEEARRLLGSGTLRALDLCAAPGGKAIGLHWSGFRVHASDRDGARMRLLEDSVRRVQATPEQLEIVPRQKVRELGPLDLVWVDAPCSGSGIIRRHPEIRWLRQDQEIRELEKLQDDLIQEGWSKVRPGGLLAYSVCSVFKSEGQDRVAAAALQGEEVRRWFLAPQESPAGDGFWATLIRKPS